MVERIGGGLEEFAEKGGVIKKKNFEEGIVEWSSSIEHHAETIGEARGAQIHFDEDKDWSLAVDRGVGIKASGEGGADFVRRVNFEGEEEIVGK